MVDSNGSRIDLVGQGDRFESAPDRSHCPVARIPGRARPAADRSANGRPFVFAAALTSLGIPKDSVIRYQADLKANKFLLIASGDAAQVEQARVVLASVEERRRSTLAERADGRGAYLRRSWAGRSNRLFRWRRVGE